MVHFVADRKEYRERTVSIVNISSNLIDSCTTGSRPQVAKEKFQRHVQTEYYTRRKESFARTKSKDHAGKIKFQLSVQSTVRDTRSKEEKKKESAL